jgi:hypothetical protein
VSRRPRSTSLRPSLEPTRSKNRSPRVKAKS